MVISQFNWKRTVDFLRCCCITIWHLRTYFMKRLRWTYDSVIILLKWRTEWIFCHYVCNQLALTIFRSFEYKTVMNFCDNGLNLIHNLKLILDQLKFIVLSKYVREKKDRPCRSIYCNQNEITTFVVHDRDSTQK